LAFTRYCFTSRLYCTIIFFANTPFIVQYIVQYYRLLHPPAQFWGIFEVFWVFFCFLGVEFRMGRGVWKIIPLSTGKRGIIAHYCAIPLSQPPFIAYNIAQYISPTTPFIAIKYWQYLVRAKWWYASAGGVSGIMGQHMHQGLAFTRYCFTSRLYCTIIFFANTPFIVQYIAQYYQLPVIAAPRPILGCLGFFFFFFFFLISISKLLNPHSPATPHTHRTSTQHTAV